MEHRDDSEFDPTMGDPNSDDAFARGADRKAGSEFDSDLGTANGPASDFERRLAEQQERYLRLAAEYDNYRKRSIRERSEAQARGQAELAKQLLDALDDLSRFAHVDPETVEPVTVVQGAEMVEKKLLKSLTSAGLEAIDPVNQTFDPTLHEAVATEPALSPEDDHVVARVYQVGYLFNGQLLRPARVVVKQWNG
jgi:molecular chaperone GrpE